MKISTIDWIVFGLVLVIVLCIASLEAPAQVDSERGELCFPEVR